MVPEEWTKTPIKKLCSSIIDCVNKTAPVVDYPTPYKMIRTTNVRHGRVDTENVKYVEQKVYEQWIRRGAPRLGDIILTREAPVGEVGLLTDDAGVFLGQRTVMYRTHEDKADAKFLLYSLQSSSCQKQIENFSNGGTVAHVRVPDCGEIIINAPPVSEQRKIAKTLSTWDEAIATTEQLLANSEQQKKALMGQLLTGKKRLLQFEGQWEWSTLAKHCTVATGNKDLQDKVNQGKYPFFVRSQNIERIDTFSFDGEAILIPGDGRVGEIFHYVNGKFDFHQRVYKLSNFEGVHGRFIYFLLRQFFKAEVVKNSVKATVDSLRMPVFTGMRLKLPSLAEQKAIARVLVSADTEIRVQQERLDRFKRERKALMQQLLTGKRRVKIDEAQAEAAPV